MKKALALALALLMLLPVVFGCMKKDKPADTAPVSGAGDTEPSETKDPFYTGVPENLDYNEHEFLISAPWPENWGIESYDREEMNNDQVNDAIYTRNRQLESRFNITISTISKGYTNTQKDEFQSYAMAGEDVIDMIAVGFYQSGRSLILADYVLPWNEVEYINLDQPWWNKSVSETLSILDNYYYLVGDVNWFTMPETAVCYFNKNVAADNATVVGDMYERVDNNEWTFDVLLDLCKKISHDNGDGVWDEKDTYGSIQNLIIGVFTYPYAANYQTVFSTPDGPVLNFNTAKMQGIIDFLYNLCCENNLSYVEAFDFTKDSKGIPIFFDDRALFYFDILMHAQEFRAYDSDFGIIPYPKYDQEQENYVTLANQWGLCCALPSTASDTTRTGAILEEMSAQSRKLIVPAYYEKTLMGKIKRDDQSEPMLDLIFQHVLYDFGICYSDCKYIVSNAMVTGKTRNLTSWYKVYRKQMETHYNELYEHVKETIEMS